MAISFPVNQKQLDFKDAFYKECENLTTIALALFMKGSTAIHKSIHIILKQTVKLEIRLYVFLHMYMLLHIDILNKNILLALTVYGYVLELPFFGKGSIFVGRLNN